MASETRNIVHIDYFHDAFCLFWSLTASGHHLLSLYGREQINVSFCVQLRNESHTVLEQHEGEYMRKEFSFQSELSL